LVLVQGLLLFALTQPSFFFADDNNYFKLAEERSIVWYILTPVLGVYVWSAVESRYRKILSFVQSAYEVASVGEAAPGTSFVNADPSPPACRMPPRPAGRGRAALVGY
jgi:hypothetical protein